MVATAAASITDRRFACGGPSHLYSYGEVAFRHFFSFLSTIISSLLSPLQYHKAATEMVDEQDNQEGASNLLSLFAPPTPPTNNSNATAKLETGQGRSDAPDTIPENEETPQRPTYQNFDNMRGYDDDDINQAQANMDAPAGSISYMMGLFSAPGGENGMAASSSSTTTSAEVRSGQKETTPLLGDALSAWTSGSSMLDATPKTNVRRKMYSALENGKPQSTRHIRLPSVAMPVIEESAPAGQVKLTTTITRGWLSNGLELCKTRAMAAIQPTTLIGAFMYLLYHVVFCLALGSAINRPHSSTSLLGLMTKTAALGTISSSAVYWFFLSSDIPALYPTADLFLAPFLANLASKVDEALTHDQTVSPEQNDLVFLATFGFLSAVGIVFSGMLLSLSGVFRLANLGSFLPFPVICGFFSAVGILTWTLAVTVDTGGKTIGFILKSGDPQLIMFTIMHHVPSVLVASVMKYLGPKNPFFVVMVVFCTIGLFYTVLFVKGISMDEAREMGWLWSREELVYTWNAPAALDRGSPPAPFGVIRQLFKGMVHWGAVADGMSTAIALGFLYVIRCSVHGAALKKNLPNLSRTVKGAEPPEETVEKPLPKPLAIRSRFFSEAVDIEAVMLPTSNGPASADPKKDAHIVRAKPSNISLKTILTPYGISQFVSALFGGFAATPSVAASSTMFSLGADGLAPQIGSVLLLVVFYTTDFQLVGYIPKPAFSSMLVLAFIDMIYTWFYKSYFKTKDKSEWLVVPAIVFCAFVFDLLSAVFLGIAFSTFIFVGSFFRSGVVKYVANGAVIHSTIERPYRKYEWLLDNGDFIQVLVLQNYLFFGNASTVYSYIASMFDRIENDTGGDQLETRKPKFLCMDLALVTGMDTSTVDIFNEIRNLCKSNHCKLFVSGLTHGLRAILSLGGFNPETTERSKRNLRFFQNLDASLGKAEDLLLDAEYADEKEISPNDNRVRLLSESDFGFRTALRHIDEEHGDNFSKDLLGWQNYTQLVELNPGDHLYKERGLQRGLFFIESGVLKIEHEASATLTRATLRSSSSMRRDSSSGSDDFSSMSATDTLSGIQAMEYSTILQASRNADAQTFRLARIGPGWIAGTLEAVSGRQRPGQHVAVTHCRLHHLPFSKIGQVEKTQPALVLHLYKLMAYTMARRQEATIGQLATLHSIMTSPAHRQGSKLH